VRRRPSAALFLRDLDDLRRAFRHYTVIHVICDNAGIHKPDKSNAVRAYLAARAKRVAVHYLPRYAPGAQSGRAGVVAAARGSYP
jgi:hypothetical protein